MANKNIIIFLAVIALIFVLGTNVASAVSWFPIVQCGVNNPPADHPEFANPCSRCDLFKLARNLMDALVEGLMPPIAVIMFMYAGFLILVGGAMPAQIKKGQSIFKATAAGIAIMLIAWIGVNFLIKSLAVDDISDNWFTITCSETVPGAGTGAGVATGTGSGTSAGATCLYAGKNLCDSEQPPGGCSNSSCPQYSSAIAQYAGGTASANLLKAIMVSESSCNVKANSGSSYGLMQLKPDTANLYASRCDVGQTITSGWLMDPTNASKSICIAAEYIRATSQTCSGIRDLIASYNGGAGACANSVDCAGETSCSNGAVKRWECLYDNSAHTICNTGFDETRGYVRKVSYCLTNPGF
jgi:hypothetical protein